MTKLEDSKRRDWKPRRSDDQLRGFLIRKINGVTFREMGKIYGVSTARAAHIFRQALWKLYRLRDDYTGWQREVVWIEATSKADQLFRQRHYETIAAIEEARSR